MYADYAFYTGAYYGSRIPEADFSRFCTEASAYLDQVTFGRLKHGAAATKDVQMAVCAVADVLYSAQTTGRTAGAKSESVGSYSVTYEDAEAAANMLARAKLEAVDRYLMRSDSLRYAGVV